MGNIICQILGKTRFVVLLFCWNLSSDDGSLCSPLHREQLGNLERSLCLSGKPGNVRICDRETQRAKFVSVREVQKQTLASFLWLISQSPPIPSKVSEVREKRALSNDSLRSTELP